MPRGAELPERYRLDGLVTDGLCRSFPIAAIAGNGVQATYYFLGTKYVEALARMGSSPNSKVLFLPVEAAGVMASIAGIGELAKESQARGAASEAAGRPRGSVPSSG